MPAAEVADNKIIQYLWQCSPYYPLFINENQAYQEQASPRKVSRNGYHEPQQNLLPQQNNPVLDMVLLCLWGHTLVLGFQTFQDAGFQKIKELDNTVQWQNNI